MTTRSGTALFRGRRDTSRPSPTAMSWERLIGWFSSLLFWPALFCAAGLFALVVVTPPLVESFELEERLAQRTGELMGLNARVEQLRRVERALLSDHGFQRRVMQAQAAAAPRADETRIAVADELHFDPRSTETAPTIVWQAPWYAAAITMLDESPGLRRSVVWTSVVLCLFAFVFLPVRVAVEREVVTEDVEAPEIASAA